MLSILFFRYVRVSVSFLLLLQYRVEATGKLQIYIENYEFNYRGRASTDPLGDATNFNLSVPLQFVQSYKPEWKLRNIFGPDIPDVTITQINGTNMHQWPWLEKTECSSPTKYRFIVCLDYEGSFDQSYPCSLARIETDLVPRDRPLPFSLSERVTFRTVLRGTSGNILVPNPIDVQFDEWKGPVQLSLYVTCCGASSLNEGQCDEVMTASISTWPVVASVGTQALRYRLTGRASVSLMVNAVCDEDYYTHSCNVYCNVQNSGREHAFCNASTGTKHCLPGYGGPDCQVDLDECMMYGNVCKNGGICRNSPGSFSCACPFSTTGRTCERRYPVCHLRPCQHQGTCIETTSGSLCLCMPGFEGQWCNMLEGQGVENNKAPQARNNDDDLTRPTAPKTPAGTTSKVMNTGSPRFKKTETQGDDGTWRNWYLAIIIGIIILIVIIFIIVFLLCKRKARKRYQVNRGSAALSNIASAADIPLTEQVFQVTQASRTKKTRSFNNAMYDDEERLGSSSSTTTSCHIFNNSSGTFNNDSDTIGNTTSISLSNNNILSARALAQQDSTGKVNFKDKTMVRQKARGGYDSCSNESKSKRENCKDHVLSSTVKTREMPNTQSISNDKTDSRKMVTSSPKMTNSYNRNGGYVNHGAARTEGADTYMGEKFKDNPSFRGRSENDSPRVYQRKSRRDTLDHEVSKQTYEGQQPEFTAVQPGGDAKQFWGQVKGNRQSEHYYEDIDSAYHLGARVPKPKPRSIHNVRNDTLKLKAYALDANHENGYQAHKSTDGDEIDLPLAPPVPAMTATAVAAMAFSSRIQGQNRSRDAHQTSYEQSRKSNGSLDSKRLGLPLQYRSNGQQAKRLTYSGQNAKTPTHMSSTKFNGQNNSVYDDTSQVYSVQQSQKIRTIQPIRQNGEDTSRNQPHLHPSSRKRVRTPDLASPTTFNQKNSWYQSRSKCVDTTSHIRENASGNRVNCNQNSDSRVDPGYVSNRGLNFYEQNAPKLHGSVDAIPNNAETDNSMREKSSRMNKAFHSNDDICTSSAAFNQPRGMRDHSLSINHPRNFKAQAKTDSKGLHSEDCEKKYGKLQYSRRGSIEGGISLSVSPAVSSSLV